VRRADVACAADMTYASGSMTSQVRQRIDELKAARARNDPLVATAISAWLLRRSLKWARMPVSSVLPIDGLKRRQFYDLVSIGEAIRQRPWAEDHLRVIARLNRSSHLLELLKMSPRQFQAALLDSYRKHNGCRPNRKYLREDRKAAPLLAGDEESRFEKWDRETLSAICEMVRRW
jgi:hypothetical protein